MNSLVNYSGSSSEDEADNQWKSSGKRVYSQDHADCRNDDSDEQVTEMPLQKRSKADSASDQKAIGILPLPGTILGMFASTEVQHTDDPQQHGGRVRSFAHVEGNWASYVYIPVSADERLDSLIDQLLQCLRPLNFVHMDGLHLSLSRTVCIRHHWIQPLTESLKEHFQQLNSCRCDVGPLKLYTNDEKTRTFLSLEVEQEEANLTDYVSAVDSCFQEFSLPGFYENPSFHISLLWCVDDVTSQVSEKTVQKMKRLTREFFNRHMDLSVIPVNQVCLKTGNKTFDFHLQNVDE